MNAETTLPWIGRDTRRTAALRQLTQPLTVSQLARRTGLSLDACSGLIRELAAKKLVSCRNPIAKRSRVYWLTTLGTECRCALRGCQPTTLPSMDWQLYGWACYSHRSAIIKALGEPMQPATIKRRALRQNPELRMSANNTRDVIKLLKEKSIVAQTEVRGAAHPRYQLTETGRVLQQLLFTADTKIP